VKINIPKIKNTEIENIIKVQTHPKIKNARINIPKIKSTEIKNNIKG